MRHKRLTRRCKLEEIVRFSDSECGKLPGVQMPHHDSIEDCRHLLVAKLVDCQGVEMAEESGRHLVPTTASWTHCCHELEVERK